MLPVDCIGRNTKGFSSGLREIIPDKHDGSYEMMRETIYSYKKLKDISVLNYKDLNLVYIDEEVSTLRYY